ncbi:MAG: glycosyltransferase family 4 protein [Chloroflexi bacterium]|nr:glycosyltransferase family 4 protein [Chloroflexota bacterium]
MRPLRIAMLAPFGIRPKGTLSARMLPLARELCLRDHRVEIVAPSYLNPEDAATTSAIDGVTVTHVRLPRLPEPAGTLETAGLLLRAALQNQPDLLHLFKPKGYGGIAAMLARRLHPDLPLIVDTDDWEGWGGWNDLAPYSGTMKHVFAWQERSLPRLASAVTVASRTLETQVWGFGVRTDRVCYIPNGVAAQPPALPDREQARRQLGLGAEPIVLLYTRFWEYPLRDVLAVLHGLRSRRPEARLLVLGSGERGEEHELDRLARRAGVAAQLDQRGWADQPTIEAAFAAADVALAPFADTLMNRAKGMAKLLQLLHAGVPVVASRVGQAREYIVEGRTGVLVPPGDEGALAQSTLDLLADPQHARRLGAAGQRYVREQFTWSLLAEWLESVYAAALK